MAESATPRLLTTVQVVQERKNGALVLDTRPAEQFASFHIRGSIQISLLGHFAAWAAILISPEQRLILIAEDGSSAHEARNRLARVGIERVAGYSVADREQWRAHGIELASVAIQRCVDIPVSALPGSSLQLIDVRSRAEWLKGHLPGAISLPLLDIESNGQLIDPSKPSLIYCHEGFRATTAASILLRGVDGNIGILIDGIEGWLASGLPLEMPNDKLT